MKDVTIQKKILSTVFISLLFVVSLITVLIVRMELLGEKEKISNQLLSFSNVIADRSLASLVFSDTNTAQSIIDALRFEDAIDHACLYDRNNTLFVSYLGPKTKYHCQFNFSPETIANDFYITQHSAITDNGDHFGEILIRARKSLLHDAIISYTFYLLSIALVALFFAYAIITNTLKKLSHPLNNLIDIARTVAVTTLSERRATIFNHDEIGELAEAFNHMLDSIGTEHQALEDSEQRFRTLANNTPVGIFQLDINGKLLYANPTWHSIVELENNNQNILEELLTNLSHLSTEKYTRFWANLMDNKKEAAIEYGYISPVNGAQKQLKELVSPLQLHTQVASYIGTLTDITELTVAQKELQQLAFYDPLTDLPNRRFMNEVLTATITQAQRNNQNIAILMLDLDNFKKVNDTLGHDAGDELLKIQATRIKETVSDKDTVARMGGDEFTIALHSADSVAEVTATTNRLLQAISKPITLQNRSMIINGSIGVALYPNDGADVQSLARHADMALYEAKNAGRNRVHFYSENLDKIMLENARLEAKLRHALENDLLELYLQPQMDAATNKIVWSEALLRWNDASEGFIGPDRFIPLAEETGLINGIGDWVLNRACQIMAEHKDELQAIGIQGIAINLSGRQFYLKNLLSDISCTFEKYDIDPTLIEFELTESVIMDDVDHALSIMRGLRNLGCRLSLDDFGTGYSSLSYLKLFPINALKIDRTFVMDIFHNPHDKAITSTIIAMAHTLGLTVIAEGVETLEQKTFLQQQNCEFLQGYFVAMPTPVNDLIEQGRKALFEQSGTL